jgi:hypothetical protein
LEDDIVCSQVLLLEYSLHSFVYSVHGQI